MVTTSFEVVIELNDTQQRYLEESNLSSLDTWPRVEQLEWQVNVQFTPHTRQHQFDIDGVGNNCSSQVLFEKTCRHHFKELNS